MLGRIKFAIEPLVNEILNQLPREVWTSATTTFLDPAMGGGQFVKEIERRLREAGHTDANISGRVYGCETSLLSVKYALNKYKLLGKYSVGDFLAQDFGDMKFDVIVGNPPYQSQAGTGVQPLWSLFVNKSVNLLSPIGYMGMITPNKWCGHTTNVVKGSVHLYNQKFKGKLLYANIQECSKYFSGVGSYANSFSYFIISNTGSKKFTVTTLEGTYNVSKPFEYLPLRCITDITFSILNKVKTPDAYDFCQVSTGFVQKNDGSIVISMAQRLHYEKLDIYYDKNSSNKTTSKSTVSRKKFNNSSTKKINNIFRSKLFKFIHLIYWNGDNFSTTFYNSLPYLDANQIWDDQKIYKHFGLTQEEIEYIEANVK